MAVLVYLLMNVNMVDELKRRGAVEAVDGIR
jgi:hypothetical protein